MTKCRRRQMTGGSAVQGVTVVGLSGGSTHLGVFDLSIADATLRSLDEFVTVPAKRIRATANSGRDHALLEHDFEFGE